MKIREFVIAVAMIAVAALAHAADQKTTLKNLPPAVKATVDAESKGEIVALESVVEHGKTRYEGRVKTKAGKTVAVEVDADGKPYKK